MSLVEKDSTEESAHTSGSLHFKECSPLLPTPFPSVNPVSKPGLHFTPRLNYPAAIFVSNKILSINFRQESLPILVDDDLTATFCVLSPLNQQQPCNLPRHEAFSAMETAATCTKCLVHLFHNTRHGCPISFAPPNYIKSRPVFSPVHQVLHRTGPSCLQYLQQCPTEGCGQQFGSSSTVELSTALGKQCRKQHFPVSCAESGANLPVIKGILSNNT